MSPEEECWGGTVFDNKAECSGFRRGCPRHTTPGVLEFEVESTDYERGIAEGERRERARVVAWLRERLIVGADAIERGEHEEGA